MIIHFQLHSSKFNDDSMSFKDYFDLNQDKDKDCYSNQNNYGCGKIYEHCSFMIMMRKG